jgi:hypothetical protein
VHTITKTQLTKLDTFVDKYTKRWAGLPKSATNVVLHSQEALDIPAISSVYTEAHNTSHARTRLQGDQTINHILDHTLAREATYTRGHKTTTEAEEMFQNTLYLNTVDGEIPSYTGVKAKQLTYTFNKGTRTKVKNATRAEVQEKLQTHARGLQVQGTLLTLASQEKEDLHWKSVCSSSSQAL